MHGATLAFAAQRDFYMVDRVKRMINVSGFRVWPSEVESMIHEHPGIAEVCVVARPDGRRGGTPLAYVVVRTS